MSRRRLITGAAAGAGLLAAWRLGPTLAATPDVEVPASAELPAARLGNAQAAPTTTTTIPGRVPAPQFTPPLPGEILFPLALGEEWTCYVLDNFGDTRGRCCGYYHQGVDIMAAQHTPQVAVVDGVLTRWSSSTLYGWTLQGDDGTVYRYFHNTSDQNAWSEGDRVNQGDVIGFVGDSGTGAGNYHLHFEYRPNNVPADSYAKLQRIPGASFQV